MWFRNSKCWVFQWENMFSRSGNRGQKTFALSTQMHIFFDFWAKKWSSLQLQMCFFDIWETKKNIVGMQGNAESQKAITAFRKRLLSQWYFGIFWTFSEKGVVLAWEFMMVLHGRTPNRQTLVCATFLRCGTPPAPRPWKGTLTFAPIKLLPLDLKLNVALALKLDGGALGL